MSSLMEDIISIAIGILLGGSLVATGMSSYYKSKAIEHNCAQYNPKTGDFEWREK